MTGTDWRDAAPEREADLSGVILDGTPREARQAALLELVGSRCRHGGPWRLGAGSVRFDREEAGDPPRLVFAIDGPAGHAEAMLTLAAAPRGWIAAELALPGGAVLRGFVDYVYEEIEAWPAGGPVSAGEAPARMGKRGNWVQIDTAVFPGPWPAGGLAERFLILDADE